MKQPAKALIRFVIASCLIMILFTCSMMVATGQSAVSEDGQEWSQLVKRFSDKRLVNFVASGMWTLTHAGESKEEIKEIVELFKLLDTSDKQNSSFANNNERAKSFKDKFAGFLDSKDDIVAGFAATMLGIAGDLRYAPAIAKLLDKKDPPDDPNKFTPQVSSRGRAAVALSLMGSREYIPKRVLMLKSSNSYDRTGAASALGELRAKEHAREVADILNKEEFAYLDEGNPIYALIEMGVGEQYVAEIAKTLRSDFSSEVTEAAAYAMAKLGAKQYAADIATLLRKEYRKGHAAKALAIMGAQEYSDEIALMLKDENGLVRSDALLALGILGAKKYVTQVAVHLKDREGYVQHFAAESLVLLEADRYASQIIPLVENGYRAGLYLDTGDFNPLVEEELIQLRKRFSDSYLRMKAVNRR